MQRVQPPALRRHHLADGARLIREAIRPDLNDIARLQLGPIDPLAVHVGAIRAAQIDQNVRGAGSFQAGVMARDQRRIEHQVALGGAANRQGVVRGQIELIERCALRRLPGPIGQRHGAAAHLTQADQIAVLQINLVDALAVDESAVAAAAIDEMIDSGAIFDDGVLGRDRGHVRHQLIRRMPPDRERVARQYERAHVPIGQAHRQRGA